MLTLAVVALVTLTALTVIPGPKLAVVVPLTKTGELTDDRDGERLALLAGAWRDRRQPRCAGEDVRKASAADAAFSPPVVSTTTRASWRERLEVTLTVADVGLVTVTRLTMTPPPSVAVVTS